MRRLFPLLLALLTLLAIAPGAQARDTLRLNFRHPLRLGGDAVGVVREPFVVTGVVSHFVRHQKVKVVMMRGGKRIFSKRVTVRHGAHGRGYFFVGTTPHHLGRISVHAVHPATRRQGRLRARAIKLSVVNDYVGGVGSRGPTVSLLQFGLARLGYDTGATGYVDAYTSRQLLAYRKVNNLRREYFAGSYVVHQVLNGRGAFKPRYPGLGHHVEADLSRQVIALIEPGGRVHRVLPTSSGKPSTPTVLGRYHFYRKEPGTNSHGMVDSDYFTGGYAIHGYYDVPTYNASHGCLRIPIPDAPFVYRWIRLGDPIDVYV